MTKKTPNDNNKSLFRRERPGDVFVPGPVEGFPGGDGGQRAIRHGGPTSAVSSTSGFCR